LGIKWELDFQEKREQISKWELDFQEKRD